MKKVLSLVLVLTLVLGSFSMVFAADNATTNLSDVSGNANEEAITVVNDLGIVTGYTDGTFKPANNVTRAEFAAMMTRALAIPESALAGYATTSFKDVAADNWAVKYLAFCDAKGIMLGDGNGNAMPNRTINVNEAVTMILRAVGYVNNSSVLVGTWPSNYVTLAQDLGIYKDVAATATVDRASAAQIVYNAIGVQKVQVATDGKTEGIGASMLTSGLKCTVGGYTVIRADENSLINLKPYQGAYAKLVKNQDKEVVAVMDVKTTFLDGEYDSTNGVFSTDDVDYKLPTTAIATAVSPVALWVDNGTVNDASTGAITIADEDATVLSVVLDGKIIKEIYARLDWTRTAIGQYAEDDFSVAKDGKATINVDGADYEFELNNKDEIDYTKFTLVGVDSLDKIPEDAVVEIWADAEYVKKITVTTDTVTGKVTKVNGSKYYIDGTAYKLDGATVALGDEGTAYLTNAGKIYSWDVADAASGNYAVVVKEGSSKDAYGNETKVVTLFTKEGKEVEYTLKDGVTTVGAATIVTYALDAKDNVKTYTDAATATAITGKVAKNNNRIGDFGVADGVVVFVYDTVEEEWTLSSLDKFDKDVAVESSTVVWAANEKGKVAALAIHDDIFGSETTLGVVNAVTGQTNTDGNNYWYVEGFLDGAALASFTDMGYNETSPAATTTTAGLQKITVDANGDVTTVVAVVAGTDVKAAPVLDVKVESVDKTNNEVSADDGHVYGLADDAVVYLWDDDDEEWTIGSISNLKNKNVKLYQSDKNDTTGEYNIILAWE